MGKTDLRISFLEHISEGQCVLLSGRMLGFGREVGDFFTGMVPALLRRREVVDAGFHAFVVERVGLIEV